MLCSPEFLYPKRQNMSFERKQYPTCRTASKTLCGIEAMHMILKDQVKRAAIGDETRAQFINKLFGLAS
jgi:transposase-like protein